MRGIELLFVAVFMVLAAPVLIVAQERYADRIPPRLWAWLSAVIIVSALVGRAMARHYGLE